MTCYITHKYWLGMHTGIGILYYIDRVTLQVSFLIRYACIRWEWPISARVIVTFSLISVSGGYLNFFLNKFTFLNLLERCRFFQNVFHSYFVMDYVKVSNEDDVLIFMDNGDEVAS